MGTDIDAKSCGKGLAHFEGEATFGEFMTQCLISGYHLETNILFPHLHLKIGAHQRGDNNHSKHAHDVLSLL